LVLTNIDRIGPKPNTLNPIEASGLPLVGVSAWQALVENIGLSKNQKILIHGGAGGIGSIAIPLAKHLGAYVATTVKSKDKEFVRLVGADEIVDYTTQSFDDILQDYDAALDTVGGETYRKSFKVLKNNGTIVSMLEQPDSNLMNQYGVKAIFQFTETTNKRLTKLAQWIDQDKLK
jgi:NADPH:quinone reductase-like Zn-dependent oxidoreductase